MSFSMKFVLRSKNTFHQSCHKNIARVIIVTRPGIMSSIMGRKDGENVSRKNLPSRRDQRAVEILYQPLRRYTDSLSFYSTYFYFTHFPEGGVLAVETKYKVASFFHVLVVPNSLIINSKEATEQNYKSSDEEAEDTTDEEEDEEEDEDGELEGEPQEYMDSAEDCFCYECRYVA